MNKMDEMIIVVPRKALFDNEQLAFQGTLTSKVQVQMLMDNIGSNFGIMRRGNAEENTMFKQPIPYAVMRKGSKVFVYERLEGGGEQRLHGKLSIGVGGHMNYENAETFWSILAVNLNREVSEELDINTNGEEIKSNIIGFINDDTNDVGKVHIGVLVVNDLPNEATVDVREKEQLKGSWLTISELKSQKIYDRLENWSKIAVDALSLGV